MSPVQELVRCLPAPLREACVAPAPHGRLPDGSTGGAGEPDARVCLCLRRSLLAIAVWFLLVLGLDGPSQYLPIRGPALSAMPGSRLPRL
jgi:hypothetical protein